MNKDFLFGVATSAYQIEGAWADDNKVPSIWDEISHGRYRQHNVMNGHTGDVSCDHYHRWEKDVELLKELGVDAYRFSISWSRVLKGPAKKVAGVNDRKVTFDLSVNEHGIKFYKTLVRTLIKNDIEPFITLYHWDLPLWLDGKGGWESENTVNEFVRYAKLMFATFPEVKHWITFNEPGVFIPNFWGCSNFSNAAKNVLIAHARTVQAYHTLYDESYRGEIGIVLNLMPAIPNTYDDNGDIAAAENIDKRYNRIWLDPLYKGCFPEGVHNFFTNSNGDDFKFTESESALLLENPMDFLGVNYYTTSMVRFRDNPPFYAESVSGNDELDDMRVAIIPWGLAYLLNKLKKDYNNPVMYVTENGMASDDILTHDSKVHDFQRMNYIREHLKYLMLAKVGGADVRGYFHWSLLDNFEWMFGYAKRFGLVYVHWPTLERIPKDSFYYYKKIIGNKGILTEGKKDVVSDSFDS